VLAGAGRDQGPHDSKHRSCRPGTLLDGTIPSRFPPCSRAEPAARPASFSAHGHCVPTWASSSQRHDPVDHPGRLPTRDAHLAAHLSGHARLSGLALRSCTEASRSLRTLRSPVVRLSYPSVSQVAMTMRCRNSGVSASSRWASNTRRSGPPFIDTNQAPSANSGAPPGTGPTVPRYRRPSWMNSIERSTFTSLSAFPSSLPGVRLPAERGRRNARPARRRPVSGSARRGAGVGVLSSFRGGRVQRRDGLGRPLP